MLKLIYAKDIPFLRSVCSPSDFNYLEPINPQSEYPARFYFQASHSYSPTHSIYSHNKSLENSIFLILRGSIMPLSRLVSRKVIAVAFLILLPIILNGITVKWEDNRALTLMTINPPNLPIHSQQQILFEITPEIGL